MDFAARQMTALRCDACHGMDDRQSILSNMDQDVATIEQDLPPAPDNQQPVGDQNPPALTWAGESLRADWMRKFIGGQILYNPRPWLAARMPAFPEQADGIARGLAMQHGVAFAETPTAVDPKLAEIGRTLSGRRGFSCVSCHAVGAQPALAPFEGLAPNFAYASDRLRHDFYLRWMRHPIYYSPGTRMAQFGDATGKTLYKNILDGDAARQYEAIWDYLQAGRRIVPPQ